MSAERAAALKAEQNSHEARIAEGIMLSKMLDDFALRVHTLYDIGKVLPKPFNAVGEYASSVLHDYKNMAYAFRRYVERGAAVQPDVEALAQRLYETSPEAGEQGISWEKWDEMEAGSGHTFVRDSYRKQAEKILTFLQGES